MLVTFSVCGMVMGCKFWQDKKRPSDAGSEYYRHAATRIEYPDVEGVDIEDLQVTPRPVTLTDRMPEDYIDITLQEIVQHALANSKVVRDLGGLILRSPETITTKLDPAVTETDPRFGVEAALSAYDASFAASAFFENNDRELNNVFFGGGVRVLDQDAAVYQAQLTKRAMTGTELILRKNTDYDSNTAPGNAFGSAWNTNIEMEARHPVWQGGGVDFNRIAGPSDVPGVYNGVLIARINTDISLAEFEMEIRNFVSNIENAYWDLYFAYRDLDAKINARNSALETWQVIKVLNETGKRGGEANKEAQAREQYYRFQEEVQNALNGKLVEGTRTNNGSGGGTFRGNGGVLVAERRLRMLVGWPINDGQLLRPADEPLAARVVFDWDESLVEALVRRVELRKQKWQVKKREKELQASQNFLKPELDLVGRYRWRGFGKDLLRQHSDVNGDQNNAFDSLTNGNHQEWQLGVELSLPIGYRQAHAAVRNAELNLARERVILKEQERQVVYDLSNTIAEKDRAFEVVRTNYNRRKAAHTELAAVQAAFEAEKASLDQVLEAQRRVATADTGYFRALIEYTLAVKNVHFEKGSLLDYSEIYLEEGKWPTKAYADALKRAKRRMTPLTDVGVKQPQPLNNGLSPQLSLPNYPGPVAPLAPRVKETEPIAPELPQPLDPEADNRSSIKPNRTSEDKAGPEFPQTGSREAGRPHQNQAESTNDGIVQKQGHNQVDLITTDRTPVADVPPLADVDNEDNTNLFPILKSETITQIELKPALVPTVGSKMTSINVETAPVQKSIDTETIEPTSPLESTKAEAELVSPPKRTEWRESSPLIQPVEESVPPKRSAPSLMPELQPGNMPVIPADDVDGKTGSIKRASYSEPKMKTGPGVFWEAAELKSHSATQSQNSSDLPSANDPPQDLFESVEP